MQVEAQGSSNRLAWVGSAGRPQALGYADSLWDLPELAADPSAISKVTTREKARAVLDHLPEGRVEAALAALEAVEGRDTSIGAILARHGEQRLDPEEFERQFGSLPTDDEG